MKICSMDVSGDDCLIGAACEDGTLKIWDISQEKCTHAFKCHKGIIRDVNFSSAGEFILTSGMDNLLKIWDLNKACCIKNNRNKRYIHRQNFLPALNT